jgi:hypothetical protein
VKSFTVNLHYTDRKTLALVKLNLGTKAFELETRSVGADGSIVIVEKPVPSTASNIAQFVIDILKKHKVIPQWVEAEVSTDNRLGEIKQFDISNWLYAGASDNASDVTCAMYKRLHLLLSNCAAHSVQLALKEACQAVPELMSLLSMAGKVAKLCKKGNGCAALNSRQTAVGITNPLSLVSNSDTRWANVVRQARRIYELRLVFNTLLESDLGVSYLTHSMNT